MQASAKQPPINPSPQRGSGWLSVAESKELIIHPTQLKKISVLGQGAFAFVEKSWLTDATGTRKVVAVKRMHSNASGNTDQDKELFLKEAQLLHRLRSPHIVEVMGMGTTTPTDPLDAMFIVQEYVAGGTLRAIVIKQMVTQRHVYRYHDALRWLIDVAEGLKFLHSSKPMIIHRDVKLDNILLTDADPRIAHAKLADFGLSAVVDRMAASSKVTSPSVRSMDPRYINSKNSQASWQGNSTQVHPAQPTFLWPMTPSAALSPGDSALGASWAGSAPEDINGSKSSRARTRLIRMQQQLLALSIFRPSFKDYNLTERTGSAFYMAPEVFLGSRYNQKADVFSFGIVMYELMHRYLLSLLVAPNGQLTEAENYLSRMAHDNFRLEVSPKLPSSVRILIERCWMEDVELRPGMEDVLQQLRYIQNSGDLDALDPPQDDTQVGRCVTWCSA